MSNSQPKKKVHVLLLTWKDSEESFWDETAQLKDVLSDTYRFTTVENWVIPSSETCSVMLRNRLAEWHKMYDHEDNLLILYYNGHGYQDDDGNLGWAATGEHDETTSLNWHEIQSSFNHTSADMLYILDTCFAVAAAARAFPPNPNPRSGEGVTELIAACGFGDTTPAPGPRSFTDALIHILRDVSAANGSAALTSVLTLHRKLVSLAHQRSQDAEGITPTPVFMRLGGDIHRPSILLQPLTQLVLPQRRNTPMIKSKL